MLNGQAKCLLVKNASNAVTFG